MIEARQDPVTDDDGNKSFENQKRSVLRKVSDFLWFGLDSWGRRFADSE